MYLIEKNSSYIFRYSVTVKSNWVFTKHKFHAELSCILQGEEIETIRFSESVATWGKEDRRTKQSAKQCAFMSNLLLISPQQAATFKVAHLQMFFS